MTTTIHWFRRDLRLQDNTALIAACHAERLIPLYIFDDTLLNSPRVKGSPRIGFMLDCLQKLDESLRGHGTRLIMRRGNPLPILRELAHETGATRLTFNRDYSSYARQRDSAIKKVLAEIGVNVEDFPDLVMHEPDAIQTTDRGFYKVYSPYKRVWWTLPKSPLQVLQENLPPLPEKIDAGQFPTITDLGGTSAELPITEAGEKSARRALDDFVSIALNTYDEGRNLPGEKLTSCLSPHLRWGTISIRQCYAAVRENPTKGAEVWISELAWRDFFYMILAHKPSVVHQSFYERFDQIRWQFDEATFVAWKMGKTGYPVVDAAMRQMNTTGWMHNRARMIVASFLCKDLLHDWRLGEQYFMQRLLDGDTAPNNGNWQWAAGTGVDAAPYFRIFNPTSQGQKFDPAGKYIRRWIPELAQVPDKFIHTPSQWADFAKTGYPLPMVDHAIQREKALTMYGVVKG